MANFSTFLMSSKFYSFLSPFLISLIISINIFFVHFHLESKDTWATQIKDALLDREDCNVILVDWHEGARIPYRRAAGNTQLVGAQVAELIRFLMSSSSGSPNLAERFYIVGFSMGAQIAGYAGAYLKARGMTLGRITGKFWEKAIMILSLRMLSKPLRF